MALEKRASVHVLVRATGVFDGSEQLTRIQDPTSLEFLEPNDVVMRIDELLVLKEGWLDGSGTAPSKAGLEWLRKELTDQWPDDIALPYLYPTPEGGIRAEWSSDDCEITAEIDLLTKQVVFISSRMSDGESEEKLFDLSDSGNWRTAADWVARFAPLEPETIGGIA